jgi:hypothetical protein
MLRAEPPVVGKGSGVLTWLPPMSFSMVVSVGLFVAGIVLWRAFRGPNDDLSFTSPDRPEASGVLPGKPATA